MSINSRLVLMIHNDSSIYRLLLIGLSIASPALHYLCFDHAFDPLYLRAICSALCILTVTASFISNKSYYRLSLYATAASFIIINNGILLQANNFEHIYVFSSVIVFMGVSFLSRQRREFAATTLVNIAVVTVAWLMAPSPKISIAPLVLLLASFTPIAYITFIVRKIYRIKFKKALKNLTELNRKLTKNQQKLRDSRNQLHALINSINDIVFEVDEHKTCLNVWYNELVPLHFNPGDFINKPLQNVIGIDRAEPFHVAVDYVIAHHKPTSLEFASVFGTDKWYLARLTPVFNRDGNYTSRISISVTDISGQKKYEDALKQNEALLLEAHAIAKLGNWWFDGETRENYWSGNIFAILEIDNLAPDADKFGMYMSLVHPDDLDSTVKYFEAITTTSPATFEHKVLTPKGNLKYIKVLRGDVVHNEAGDFKRISGVIQDITEIRLSEKSARVNRAELIEAQTIAKIGNWKWEVSLGLLTWSDEINNIYEMSGNHSSHNFIRMFLKYVHPDDKYIFKKLVQTTADVTNISYEYRIITPTGQIKHLSAIVDKLLTRDGNLRKIIGTVQDITERKIAEIEYKRSENKYKLVLESVKLAALTVNGQGKVTFCNKYLSDLLGYKQHEVIGARWVENFVPENLHTHLYGWINGQPIQAHFINPVVCRDGQQRVISWQNTVTFDEQGRVKEITAIGEDITDQQKATQELITAKEDAERSSRFKSEFLSTMSHEIRTPMNAVIGTTNLLLSESPRPEQMEYLNTLKFSGENLLAIINDILDYNKIEAGKLELHTSPVNIQQLAQKIIQSFQLRARQKNLELKLITDSNLPGFVSADKVRISQVLNNLVGNAIKFTDSGSVLLRIDNAKGDQKQAAVKFTVADTGIGIAPENLGMIFDPFTQEAQTSNHYGGTGLGLAITKRLIDLHQSTIEVESSIGKGTQFSFTINFEITNHPEEAPATPAEKLLQDLTGMHILIVDDNRMNLLIASKFLKKWHAAVDEATNGEIAVQMNENNTYDLIIMDLQMPVMDGFNATQLIKKTHPLIPIIALTADAMPETYNKAFEAGMCDYLTKPFLPETLFEKVSKHYIKKPAPFNAPVK